MTTRSPSPSPELSFLPGSAGSNFSIYYPPFDEVTRKPAVLFVPPFAEEMNKSRRQVSLQARDFAARGFPVLTPDLYGTGESEGDFHDARWRIWRDDLIGAANWIRERHDVKIILWGLRLGGLMAFDLLAPLGEAVSRILLWQPVISGQVHMTQFIRLRAAAEMLGGHDSASTSEIRAELARGNSVEIAGYTLHPELAAEIESLAVTNFLSESLPCIDWFEMGGLSGALPPASKTCADKLRGAGSQVRVETIEGDPFWTTTEIAVSERLIEKTSDSLAGATM